MLESLMQHEPSIRLAGFGGVLFLMALLEACFPRRPRALGRWRRWPGNMGVVMLDTLVLRLLFPAAAVGLAAAIAPAALGLLPWLGLPGWARVLVAVVLLDLAIYLQHTLFHAVPLLWRLHRMHHADTEFDVTTGLRFHPAEIVLSLLIKLMLVVAIGAPPEAVLIFEVLLNASAMFNHANLALPLALDRLLRLVLVTPDMHRVHHSVLPHETNSNFGFCLALWDRLFGTYVAQPSAGHGAMSIGLTQFRDLGEARLDRMLTQPLRGAARGHALEPR